MKLFIEQKKDSYSSLLYECKLIIMFLIRSTYNVCPECLLVQLNLQNNSWFLLYTVQFTQKEAKRSFSPLNCLYFETLTIKNKYLFLTSKTLNWNY